jgi:hypothetical protein
MIDITEKRVFIKYYRIILILLFIECCIYFFSGVSVTGLYGNNYFTFEQDPLLWGAYFSKLPQFILSIKLYTIIFNLTIVLFFVLLFLYPLNNLFGAILFLLMLLFYFIFTGHLGHRNYQCGYVFILLPFLFRKITNRQIMYECCRYFLLFFYVSAALFKLKMGSIFDLNHMSIMVSDQFTPYFLEHNYSMRTDFNLFLVGHHTIAYILYVGAFLLELSAVIGFFTKKYDKYLAIIMLLFHATNWFIMDIAPIGQISFICLLFMSNKIGWGK